LAQAVAALGALDVLVNNAGANLRKAAIDVTVAEWDEIIATNVTGTFFLSQEFGRHLIPTASWRRPSVRPTAFRKPPSSR
jgi:NAD(P)-dependent dehydrogenase (short-subunit alcohol dehydrogenase family)